MHRRQEERVQTRETISNIGRLRIRNEQTARDAIDGIYDMFAPSRTPGDVFAPWRTPSDRVDRRRIQKCIVKRESTVGIVDPCQSRIQSKEMLDPRVPVLSSTLRLSGIIIIHHYSSLLRLEEICQRQEAIMQHRAAVSILVPQVVRWIMSSLEVDEAIQNRARKHWRSVAWSVQGRREVQQE
jgi:hypothetical protein